MGLDYESNPQTKDRNLTKKNEAGTTVRNSMITQIGSLINNLNRSIKHTINAETLELQTTTADELNSILVKEIIKKLRISQIGTGAASLLMVTIGAAILYITHVQIDPSEGVPEIPFVPKALLSLSGGMAVAFGTAIGFAAKFKQRQIDVVKQADQELDINN